MPTGQLDLGSSSVNLLGSLRSWEAEKENLPSRDVKPILETGKVVLTVFKFSSRPCLCRQKLHIVSRTVGSWKHGWGDMGMKR